MIADSLRTVGAARSIVIDETNEVIAGNGVVEAAPEAGLSKVQIVEADGNTIIAVRRRGLTPDQKRALALFDNRTSELSEWNPEQLKLDAAAGLDLQPFFFDAELAAILSATDPIATDFVPSTSAYKGMKMFAVIVTAEQYTTIVETLKRLVAEGHDAGASSQPMANALVWVLTTYVPAPVTP
jgi:hypothetical protein